MDPTAARKEPMAKVMEITPLMFIPMSFAVSKSLLTARIAIPVLVLFTKIMRTTTRPMVMMGVSNVTNEALRSPI